MFDDVLSILNKAFVGPIDIELLRQMDTDGCPMDLLDNQLCIGYFIDIQWIEILKMGPNFWIFLATEKWGVSWIHPMVSLLYWVSNSLNGFCLPLGDSS